MTNIFTLNLTPYLFMFIGDCKFCCRKSPTRSQKRIFSAEENYIRRLITIIVVFSFGLGMPILFVLCFIPVGLTLLIDEILVVYWLKPTNISAKLVYRFLGETFFLASLFFLYFGLNLGSIAFIT